MSSTLDCLLGDLDRLEYAIVDHTTVADVVAAHNAQTEDMDDHLQRRYGYRLQYEALGILQRENERLREALRFYAEEAHWLDGACGEWVVYPGNHVSGSGFNEDEFEYDHGEIAREALGERSCNICGPLGDWNACPHDDEPGAPS